MSIKIFIPSFLMHLADDTRVVDINGSTVGECLGDLIKRFPETKKLLLDNNGKLLNRIDIFVNGKSSYPEGLAKLVNEGDEIHIISLLAGG